MRLYGFFAFLFFLFNLELSSQELSLVLPKDGQVINGSYNLSWNTLESSDYYRLKLANTPAFINPVLDTIITSPNCRLSLLNGNYFWKIIAYSNGMAIDSGKVNSFIQFNPNEMDSIAGWYRADTALTIVGLNEVSNWGDISGKGNDIIQIASNRNPDLQDSVINSYPALYYNNIIDKNRFANSINSKNYSISLVYNYLGSNSRRRLIYSRTNWFMGIDANEHTSRSNNRLNGTPYTAGRFVVQNLHSSNDTSRNIVNGQEYGKGYSIEVPGSNIRIGEDPLDGYIGEILLYIGTINSNTRALTDSYLMDKYAPPVNLGADQTVCTLPITLEATKDTYLTYAWSTGANTSSIIANTSGFYAVTVTDIFGRSSSDSVHIEQDISNFQVTLPPDTILCLGDTLELNLKSSDLYSYVWNTGETGKQIKVDSSGWYKITVNNCSGNLSSDSIFVQFNRPEFSLGADTSICFGNSILLSPDSLFTSSSYSWNTMAITPSFSANSSGLYSLTVTDAYNCMFSDSIQVSVDSSLFDIDLGPDTSLCIGNVLGLISPVSNADGYFWNTGDTDSIVYISTSRQYILTVSKNGCSNSDSVFVNLKGLAPIAGFESSLFCLGDSTRFMDTSIASGNIPIISWRWNFGNGALDSVQNPVFFFDSVGTYPVVLRIENDSNCFAEIQQNIQINPKPNANFSTSISCEGSLTNFLDNSSISSGLIAGFSWNFGDLNTLSDSSHVRNPSYVYNDFSLHQVQLIVSSDFACLDTQMNAITTHARPNASFLARSFYLGDSVKFTNTSSIPQGSLQGYLWDYGDGTNGNSLNDKHKYNQVGTYRVQLDAISNQQCTDVFVDTVIIEIRPPAQPLFSTVYPKNGEVLHTTFNFLWNYSDTGNYYTVEVASDTNFASPIQYASSRNYLQSLSMSSGTYYWRVLAMEKGRSVDTSNFSKFIVFNALEVDSLAGWYRADTGLVFNGGLNVGTWQDLSPKANDLVQTISTRLAEKKDSILNNFPALEFDGLLDKYIFTNGIVSDNYSVSLLYNYRGTSNRRRLLYNSAQWYVGINSNEHAAVENTFLNGSAVVSNRFVTQRLSALNDTVSHFVNGEKTDFHQQSPINLNVLRLAEDPLDGYIPEMLIVDGSLSKEDAQTMDQYLMDKYAPPINLGPDKLVCSFPQVLNVYKDTYLSYTWSNGSTDSILQIDSAGLYVLTVQDIFNRVHTDSLFFILDTSQYVVDFGFDDTTVCQGTSIDLIAGKELYNYSWNTGDTSYLIEATSDRWYVVTVTNCFASPSTDSVRVHVNQPVFDLGPDTSICFNDNILLKSDSSFVNVSYIWSNNTTNSSILINQPGKYNLTVTDSYQCSYSDSILISVDSSLFGLSLGPDASLCKGNAISLLDAAPNGTNYLWSNGLTSPQQLIDSAGHYTITLSYAGCTVKDTANYIILGDAPQALFSAVDFCFGDSSQFFDLSAAPAGDSLVSWFWNFGDGDTTSLKEPKHQYHSLGNYTVQLLVTTDKGCRDTISNVFNVNPLPQVDFSIINSCSKAVVRFRDNSSISSGNLIRYFWDFGDTASASNFSSLKNDDHQYDTLGNYSIKLIVESSLGCKDSLSKLKTILPSPNILFYQEGKCFGDSSFFYDQSTIAAGSINSYFWSIDNQISLDKNPRVKINTSGSKQIYVTVTSDSLCSSNYSGSIDLFNKPKANFSTPNICFKQVFQVSNLSTVLSDSIVEFKYIFNGADTSNIANPSFLAKLPGSSNLKLIVTSSEGCIDSIQKTLPIGSLPRADFRILNNNTGVPFELRVANNSTGASNYKWFFGTGDSSLQQLPLYTYTDTGKYPIQLIAESNYGCKDTLLKTANALPYFLDAELNKIILSETASGFLEIGVRVFNLGNNTIKNFDLIASVNNQYQVRESVQQELFSGGLLNYNFTSSFLKSNSDQVDFVCVRIGNVNSRIDEVPENNEKCESFGTGSLYLAFYPNPVHETLSVEFVLPEDGEMALYFYDQMGRRFFEFTEENKDAGLYQMAIDFSKLPSGIYHYEFLFNGTQRGGSIIKQ